MAGTFGPYDPASPCVTTFCSRISKEEYEKQASEATQQALADLIKYLEYNPTAYYNILRKRKREDQENEGVFSWLKVKMLSAIHGDDYCENVNKDEARLKLANMKDDMIRAYDYAEGAKGSGKRFSKRLIEKKELSERRVTKTVNTRSMSDSLCNSQDNVVKSLEKDLLAFTPNSTPKQQTATSKPFTLPPTPPPPPPLPPIVFSEPIQSAISNRQSEVVTSAVSFEGNVQANLSSSQVRTRSKSKTSKENLQENSAGSLNDLLTSIRNPQLRQTLKPVNIGTTDETPGQIRKKLNKIKSTTKSDFPLFNQQLLNKFQNARSPQSPQYFSDVSPSGSFAVSP